MFLCISYYLGAFGIFWLRYKTQCKTGQISAKVRGTKSRRNFSQECTRDIPLDSKLIFWCVLYYLEAFGTVWLPYKTRFKMSRSGEKVCAMKSCWNFSQRSTRSTPLDPNLMFLCISYYLCAFGTFWLRYKTQCKTGQTSAKVCATKSRRNFSQRTLPIHPSGP